MMHKHLGLILFTLGYTCFAALYAFSQGNWEFSIYILVMLIAGFGLWRLDARIPLPASLLWLLSIWGLLHLLGGLLPIPTGWPYLGRDPILYNLWLLQPFLKYDQFVHAYGFGITAWVFWVVLQVPQSANQTKQPNASFGILFICVGGAMGMGALNELIEFITTLFIEDTNVGDYRNTGFDLLFNFIGAVIAAILIRVLHQNGSRTSVK